jgi:selenide,water dikinase
MFEPTDHPDLLVGLSISDDAAVYRVTDELAVIQTVDFFPPIVNDPYDYGAIAAANALSDIYAMGGEVTLALNIAGFPPDLGTDIVGEILHGGAEKVREAGGVIAGGHTIDLQEPVYGLAVMGMIHPERVMTKAAVQPGDILLLTKKLGVGIITTALKGGVAEPAHVSQAVASMKALNREAAAIIRQVGVRACTDITGFGLLGHGYEMAVKSGVRLRFRVDALPFHEGAVGYAADWLFPAGACRNEDCYRPHVKFGPGVLEEIEMLLFTPETSGGLLIAVAPGRVSAVREAFAAVDHPVWQVGEAVDGPPGIDVVSG